MKIPDLIELAKDRVKTAYLIVVAGLSLLAYLLLIQIDVITFFKLNDTRKLAEQDLGVLRRASDYESLIKQFDSEFTNDKGANWFMETVTRMADQEGVILQSLKPLNPERRSGYRIIKVLAEGRSGYVNMARLMNRLENYEKYIFIENFVFGMTTSQFSDQAAFSPEGQQPVAPASGGPIAGSFELLVSSFDIER